MHSRVLESRYEVLRRIGHDGFESDYVVKHRQLDQLCRVRVRPHGLDDPSKRERFDRYLPWFTRLKHPRLAPVYDVYVADETWAVLETAAVEGPALDTLMVDASLKKTGAALPVMTALKLADQILDAVGYLHGEGWAHGSLAPERFTWIRQSTVQQSTVRRDGVQRDSAPDGGETRHGDGEGGLLLTDPGFARLVGASERTTAGGLLMRRLRYSPPEQFLGEAPDGSTAADIYVLGLILYEMLTGRYPVSGDHPTSLAAGHLLRPILPFNESDAEGRVPAAIRAAVERCLEKQAEHRFASVEALREALRQGRPPSPATEQQVIDLWLSDDEPEAVVAAAVDYSTRDLSGAERAARSRRLLEEARVALAGDDHEGARRRLREAQRIAPEDANVAALLREVEKGARERRLEKERQRAVELIEGEVDRLLAAGDWRSAQARVNGAVERHGGGPRLKALRERVDAAERRELETRPEPVAKPADSQVEVLVERARRLSQSEDLEQAQSTLRQALDLDPGHPAARTLSESLQALMALQEGEGQRQESLDRTTQSIRRLLEDGNPGAALAQLQRAVTRHGDRQELQALRYQIAEAFLSHDLGRDSLPAPELPQRPPSPPPSSPAAREPEGPGAREAVPVEETEDRGAVDLPLFGGPEAVVDEPAQLSVAVAADDGAARRLAWAVLILILMASAAALGYWAANRGQDQAPQSPPPVEAQDVSPAPSGT